MISSTLFSFLHLYVSFHLREVKQSDASNNDHIRVIACPSY